MIEGGEVKIYINQILPIFLYQKFIAIYFLTY